MPLMQLFKKITCLVPILPLTMLADAGEILG